LEEAVNVPSTSNTGSCIIVYYRYLDLCGMVPNTGRIEAASFLSHTVADVMPGRDISKASLWRVEHGTLDSLLVAGRDDGNMEA